MSLLLDALKRAEQEKLARQAARNAESGAEEVPERSQPVARTRNFELESMEPARGAEPAAAPATPAAAPGDRASAQAVFAAKTDAPSREAAGTSKAPLVAAGVAVVLAIAAGGAYVWFQINSFGPRPYAARAQQQQLAPRPVPQDPVPQMPAAMPPAAPVPPPASGVVPTNPAAPPVALFRPESVPAASRRAATPPADAEKLVLDLLRESPAPAAAPPLKLARSMVAPKVSPELGAGYEALRQGDLANARRYYQAALAGDPNGIDALLGLATVEGRAGDRAGAQRLYRKVLTLDAKNATALAGLAAVADLSRPESIEPTLRADIARYPNSAALHMTLGNLYASQSRWADAQSAFFEAHRLDPQNADVLYNLAVALDNLNQAKLAGDFYRRALAQAKGQAVQFDARAAERRLGELPR